ncbi:MAG: transcriptional repressor [Hyphomicrobiaceae bacterium]|nr:transcriptional repressor [Hyphomicrobiaceae bacterium]
MTKQDRGKVLKNAARKAMEAALRDAGLRFTAPRAALLDVLAAADDHPDAGELHQRVRALSPSVSLSTVYRCLTALEAQGLVQRLTFDGAPARFETTDAPHHDHIIDVDTGDVIEFRSDKIEKLQAMIVEELGYELVHHRLELYCRKRSGA